MLCNQTSWKNQSLSCWRTRRPPFLKPCGFVCLFVCFYCFITVFNLFFLCFGKGIKRGWIQNWLLLPLLLLWETPLAIGSEEPSGFISTPSPRLHRTISNLVKGTIYSNSFWRKKLFLRPWSRLQEPFISVPVLLDYQTRENMIFSFTYLVLKVA